ncbi:MAG: response regulator transcription factor [Opitutaceae bacterium]|nr:response regulator transcription factor [Opitutaceae bacterium]
MSTLPRILVVDDDRAFVHVVTYCLECQGYRVIEAFDGKAGIDLAIRERPALVVLDIEMPLLDGFKVCRELRRLNFDSPILMLTGKSEIECRVSGLDAGADDYLAKPCDPRELLARIRALLRKRQRAEFEATVLYLGSVQVDLAGKTALCEGKPLPLTRMEYALLVLLARNAGRPVSRETILDVVCGCTRFPSTRTVDTHIWRLRKKIGDDGENPRWVKSIPGQGYCLVLTPE